MTPGRRLSPFDWKGYVEYFARPKLGALLWQFFFFAFSFALFISGFALFAQRRYTLQGQRSERTKSVTCSSMSASSV